MQAVRNFGQLIFNNCALKLHQQRLLSNAFKSGKVIFQQQPQHRQQQVKGFHQFQKLSFRAQSQRQAQQQQKLQHHSTGKNVEAQTVGTVKGAAKKNPEALAIETKPPSTKIMFYSLFSSALQKGRLCLVLVPVTTVSCVLATNANRTFSTTSIVQRETSDSKNPSTMSSEVDYKNAKSIYDFTVKDTHGNDVSLEKYRGQVVLIVNIASKCGLTKNNYKKLTDLKEKYHDKGLRVLNFPCNQFGSQMPEADGEPMVCHLRDSKADIGDVFQKIDVNGSGAAPLYKYLKEKQSGTLGSAIKWNFTKFLVNKEGIPVDRYAPTTDPMDIAKDIEKLL